MDETRHYSEHIAQLQRLYEQALQRTAASAVLVFSGTEQTYFGDDRGVPFQAYGHFCHWLPVNRPDQALLIRPGERPIYFQIKRADFWYDQSMEVADWWAQEFDIVSLADSAAIAGHCELSELAYLGDPEGRPESLGVQQALINPAPLVQYLDYQRAYKTDYEKQQLRAANALAMAGHRAARDCFLAGGSEFDIHFAYLRACRSLENETPYTNIVALNQNAAILHYQNKRRDPNEKSRVLLIDAGARVRNYGSDITRTTANEFAPEEFHALLQGVENLQETLVQAVRPGLSYAEIHRQALAGVAEILIELKICLGSAEDLLRQAIPALFMPHGVGHLLGIQVHDVGGHQSDSEGSMTPPPESAPMLRNTRKIESGMVFTIEPGCYFIPMLLEPERQSGRGSLINWQIVDRLYPCGGVRIEDNILVTANGCENLTRQA